jgi:hypothetical protein
VRQLIVRTRQPGYDDDDGHRFDLRERSHFLENDVPADNRKSQIEHDRIEPLGIQQAQSLQTVCRLGDPVPAEVQRHSEDPAKVGVVFDD